MSQHTRRRYTAEERDRWVERYVQSGLTQREFAANHNLGLSNLQRWAARAAGRVAAFAEVTLPPVPATMGWTAEIVRSGRATLRCTNAITPGLLEHLLRAC